MNYSDEILMAYADGELDEPQRSEVDAAVRADPALARIVAGHRALRRDVAAAFAGVLDEPVPARLQPTAGAKVLSFEAARSARGRTQAPPPRRISPSAWPKWAALAATVVVGVLAGSVWLHGGGDDAFVSADAGGRLTARGELASALSRQLASEPARGSAVRIGVSFAARGSSYCRSFSAGAKAGLACRDGESWRIPVLTDAPPGTGDYRQAGSAPGAVLEAIDERMAGEPLDAAAEKAARDRGWKR